MKAMEDVRTILYCAAKSGIPLTPDQCDELYVVVGNHLVRQRNAKPVAELTLGIKSDALGSRVSFVRVLDVGKQLEAGTYQLYTQSCQSKAAEEVDREYLGQQVREVWIAWAKEQPVVKASWLMPWDGMSEPDREVDRRIGEHIARIVLRAAEPS